MSERARRQEASRWTVGEVELDRERSLHFAERGEGAPIVLIHGAMLDHDDWTMAADAAALPGRLIAVDRPGHGMSRRPRFEGSLERQARQLHDGLKALGVQRPILVGHSLGGGVALAYGVCAREAEAQGKTLENHLTHLVAHGVLHLLGYDHMPDAEAEEMEALEKRILSGLGAPDPYASETAAHAR